MATPADVVFVQPHNVSILIQFCHLVMSLRLIEVFTCRCILHSLLFCWPLLETNFHFVFALCKKKLKKMLVLKSKRYSPYLNLMSPLLCPTHKNWDVADLSFYLKESLVSSILPSLIPGSHKSKAQCKTNSIIQQWATTASTEAGLINIRSVVSFNPLSSFMYEL